MFEPSASGSGGTSSSTPGGPSLGGTRSLRLYRVLNVAVDASQEDIRRSYRNLALQYHPDRAGPDSAEMFKEITAAYDVLSDPKKRKSYNVVGDEGYGLLSAGDLDLFTPSIVAVGCCLACCLITSLLIFPILLAVKIDAKKSWSWAALLTPVWIVDFVCAVFACYILKSVVEQWRNSRRFQAATAASGGQVDATVPEEELPTATVFEWRNAVEPLALALHLVLFVVFSVLLLLAVQSWQNNNNNITFTFAFIPLWVLVSVYLLVKTFTGGFSRGRWLVDAVRFDPPPTGSSPTSASAPDAPPLPYPIWVVSILWSPVLFLVQIVLLPIKTDGYIQVSWWLVFAPLFASILVPVVLSIVSKCSVVGEVGSCAVCLALLPILVIAAVPLAFIILLCVRLTTENVSMSVVLIPLFLGTGAIFCVCCIALPTLLCTIQAMKAGGAGDTESLASDAPLGARAQPERVYAADYGALGSHQSRPGAAPVAPAPVSPQSISLDID